MNPKLTFTMASHADLRYGLDIVTLTGGLDLRVTPVITSGMEILTYIVESSTPQIVRGLLCAVDIDTYMFIWLTRSMGSDALLLPRQRCKPATCMYHPGS